MAEEVEFVSDEDIPKLERVKRKDIFTGTVCLIILFKLFLNSVSCVKSMLLQILKKGKACEHVSSCIK